LDDEPITLPELKLVRWESGEKADNSVPVTITDFKDKFVIINFWASWCAPCVAEMPALERLYQKLKGEGLEILAVNVEAENKRQQVEGWFKSKGLSFSLAFDHDSTTADNFGITGFPETFFVSRDGKLITVIDPESYERTDRLISDRPWDSPLYIRHVSRWMGLKKP